MPPPPPPSIHLPSQQPFQSDTLVSLPTLRGVCQVVLSCYTVSGMTNKHCVLSNLSGGKTSYMTLSYVHPQYQQRKWHEADA